MHQFGSRLTRPWLVFAAGALLSIGLPPVGWWPVIFVSLPVALAALQDRQQTLRASACSGFFFGLGYFAAALHWIGFAFIVDSATYLWMMPFAVGGLAALMAAYWSLAFVAAHVLSRRGIPVVASLPLSLATAEIARGQFFTGFPWAAPGLMADGMGGVLQLASLIGMEGLSYWILLWGMLPFVLWRARDHGRAGLVIPLLLLLLLPASWVWGRWRLAALHDGEVAGVTLLLVQPNVAQGDKWNGEKARMIFERLMTLSTEGEAANGASHIIWPESAVPFLLDESADGLREVAGMLRPDKRLVTGAIRREGRDGGERYFTSILEVDPQGLVEARYDKWRLVPGGEFLPFAWLLEPLGFRKVVSVPESFSAGRGPGSFDLGAAGRAGLLICYEAIFPDRLVETEHRPDWIINVTNDAWFGRSVGPYQHLAQVRMRAVEHNLPIARAANSGISAIMDGGGRYIARSLLDTEAAISGPLPRAGAQTVFASRGRMPAALAALAAALLLVFAVARRERG